MWALGSQEGVSNSTGDIFSIFNVALLVHSFIFVFLRLPLTSILQTSVEWALGGWAQSRELG